MHEQITAIDTPIRRGIKSVGVGKKGNKDLEQELVQEILSDLQAGKVSAVEKGAFFAGLTFKGLTGIEGLLEKSFAPGVLADPHRLALALSADAPAFIQDLCGSILNQKKLDQKTAERLGDFLFSELPGDGARGLIAVALRVRYETIDEYHGLLNSLNKTITPGFRAPVPAGEPVLQLADPFDGVDHSFSITPIIAQELQKCGYRVVTMTGRNSGPKFGNNLLDLAQQTSQTFARNTQDLAKSKPPLGWVIRQEDLSKPLDRWVELRRQIIKRPFLATLEKFLNPCRAKILITSAFHAIYGEKMTEIAQRAGFPGIIIVRNGMEGTIAFPLKRNVKILCSAQQMDGTYKRTEFELNPAEIVKSDFTVEERQENPSLKENGQLIQTFVQAGQTKNALFDSRVKFTCAGLIKAVEWLEKNMKEATDDLG